MRRWIASDLYEAVRARPALYDSNTKSYKDADKKAAAWRAVAASLEVSGRCNIHDDEVHYYYLRPRHTEQE